MIHETLHAISNKEYPPLHLIDHDDLCNAILHTPLAIYNVDYKLLGLDEEEYEKENIKDIKQGITLCNLLCQLKVSPPKQYKVPFESTSDARKAIREGSIRINYKKITDEFTLINEKWLKKYNTLLVQKGKKTVFFIKVKIYE